MLQSQSVFRRITRGGAPRTEVTSQIDIVDELTQFDKCRRRRLYLLGCGNTEYIQPLGFFLHRIITIEDNGDDNAIIPDAYGRRLDRVGTGDFHVEDTTSG